MSKFNKTKEDSRVENYMGAKAYQYDDKLQIISILLTSFAEDSYYESNEKTTGRLKELIEKAKDKLFVAKTAVFARNEFGMRSITHLAAGELAKFVKGETWTKRFYDKVCHRVDDITEILSYYKNTYGKPFPNSLRRGLAKAILKFDGYQLAKYRGENKDLSLIDAVNIIRPKPDINGNVVEVDAKKYEAAMRSSKKNSAKKNSAKNLQKSDGKVKVHPLTALMYGLLKSTGTWEAKVSAAGKSKDKKEAKKEAWSELVTKKKIGYFALLKNLRNILQQAPEITKQALAMLTEKNRIHKSLVLPFRFLRAYEEIEKIGTDDHRLEVFESERVKTVDIKKVLAALNTCVELSIDNIPKLNGKTLILSDNSGSMTGDSGGSSAISAMGHTKTSDIANLFSVMYWKKCTDTLIGLFGDKLIYPKLDREKSLFDNYKIINREKNKCGVATETGIFKMFERLVDEKMHVDTIVVFSDCQIGTGCSWYDTSGRLQGEDFNKLFNQYRKINPNFNIYSVDLKNYGTTVFGDHTFKLFGWSEKIFEIMKILEQDKQALIKKIEAVEI